MYKSFLLFALFLLTSALSYSQGYNWSQTFGGINDDSVHSIVADASGNVILVGSYRDTVDFEPGPGTFKLGTLGMRIFIQKLDASGNLLWAKNLTGGTAFGHSVVQDASGNLYVTGAFQGTVDFDPGPGVYNMTDTLTAGNYFMLKLNSAGGFLWAKREIPQYQGLFYAEITSKAAIDNSNVYMIYTYADYRRTYFSKYDYSGNLIWNKSLESTNNWFTPYMASAQIAADNTGNIYIAACYMGEFDLDPTASIQYHRGNGHPFVAKYNSSGDLVWFKDIVETAVGIGTYIEPTALAVDKVGNLLIAVSPFVKTPGLQIDADPNAGTAFMATAFVTKWSSTGNYIWAQDYLGNRINALAIDASNNVYMTGSFGQYLTINSIGVHLDSKSANDDAHIAKLSGSAGNCMWVQQIGSNPGTDVGLAMALTNTHIYTAGVFSGVCTFNFDPNKAAAGTSKGFNDWYVHKMKMCTPATPTYSRSGNVLTSNVTADAYYWINCSNKTVVSFNKTCTLTASDNYRLVTETQGCYDSSACNYLTLGVDNFKSAHSTVYPNPTTEEVNISMDRVYGNVKVDVMNVLGQIVNSKSISGTDKFSVLIPGSSGLYQLTIITDDQLVETVTVRKD